MRFLASLKFPAILLALTVLMSGIAWGISEAKGAKLSEILKTTYNNFKQKLKGLGEEFETDKVKTPSLEAGEVRLGSTTLSSFYVTGSGSVMGELEVGGNVASWSVDTQKLSTGAIEITSTDLVENLNADMLDNLSASTTPTPSSLLALDPLGKFPNSVLYTGAGQGLDADMLDGMHASQVLSLQGGTMTGDITFNSTQTFGNATIANLNELVGGGVTNLHSHPGGGGLWTDGGTYIYPSNVGTSFQISDTTGNIITSGTVTASSFSGSGSALTSLNASELSSGTVPQARLSGSYTGVTGVGTLTTGTWNAQVIADAYVADNITLTNITQIINRSHTSLTDIGSNTHAQIDTHIASSSAHGTTGNIVGTSDTQTLTNKTLSTGSVWNGEVIGLSYGGTGANLTAVSGGILYSGASTLAISTAGSTDQLLTSGGTGAPTFQNITSLLTAGTNITISGTTNATIATVPNPSFSTSVTSPTFRNDGDITIDALNATANSTVGIINSDPTYGANLNLSDGSLQTAGVTRISNSGAGTLTSLDLASGGITNTGSITGVGANITGTGALTLSSGGTSDLTLDSASGTVALATGDSLSVPGTLTVSTTGSSISGTLTVGTLNATSAIQTGGTQRIDASGNLLNIGTTQFNGVTYTWPASDGTSGYVLSTDGLGTLSWVAQSGGGSTVWSDLTDPTANLSLSMGAYTSTFTYNAATGTNNLFNLTDTLNNTGTGYLLNVTTATGSTLKPFHVSAAGTEALVVDASGNVGIGKTTPGAKLHVADSSTNTKIARFVASASTQNSDIVWIGSGATSGYNLLKIDYGPSYANNALTVRGDGNVGIGTTSPGYKLDVAGSAHASSFPTSSDIRFKENITPIKGVLEKLENIQGIYFNWNDLYTSLGRATPGRQIGVIAQDIEQVFPELVTTWGDDYRAVDYGRFSAVLLEGLKELHRRVKEIEPASEKLAQLEQRIAFFEAQPENHSSTTGILTQEQSLILDKLALSDDGTILVVKGNLEIEGKLAVGNHLEAGSDTGGVIKIPAGSTETKFNFAQKYTNPRVVLTPTDDIGNLRYWVKSTPNYFVVYLSDKPDKKLEFNFFVVEVVR